MLPVASSVWPALPTTEISRAESCSRRRSSESGSADDALSPRRSAASRVLVAEVADDRVDRAAAEVEAGVERAFDLDVEPALDRARDELVAHRVDQHAGQDADQGEDRRQLEQQAAAEAAARDAPEQAHGGDDDDRDERARQRDVDPEQPDVVALVESRVVGRDAEQEGEHQAGAEGGEGRDDPGPAAAPGSGGGSGLPAPKRESSFIS